MPSKRLELLDVLTTVEKKAEALRAETTALVSQKGGRPKGSSKRIRALLKAQQIDLFKSAFIKNNGNATEAYLTIHPTASRMTARSAGAALLKQIRNIHQVYLEEHGATYGDLVGNMIEKNKVSKTPDWSDRLMRMAGYEDFMTKEKGGNQVGVINIINAQKKVLAEYGDSADLSEVVEGEIDEE